MTTAPEDGGILLLGAGALGCAAALGLLAAGERRLTLADGDRVELSNLHRQVWYGLGDLQRPKCACAVAALAARGGAGATPLATRLEDAPAIAAALTGHRLLIDGSDNFATRFAANDAALATGKPLVHGAATGRRGQLLVILPGRSACLRCLFEGPPAEAGATCQQAGVVGPGAGLVGWLMALEAVKLLHRLGDPLAGRLLTVDFLSGQRREIAIRRRPDCAGCGSIR